MARSAFFGALAGSFALGELFLTPGMQGRGSGGEVPVAVDDHVLFNRVRYQCLDRELMHHGREWALILRRHP